MILKHKVVNLLDGILLVDKPINCTSFDVVYRIRKQYSPHKIGHAGTLDPMATGLLVILLGKATKLSQALMSGDKRYEGTIQLGTETSTYDAEGEITQQAPYEAITMEDIQKSMSCFLGDQYQEPPMFSAKKINGVPLYKLARKGQEVERKPHFITIHQWTCKQYVAPDIRFEVDCSKGTYVRSLAHDLGKKLGTCAHLTSLRRLRSGQFDIQNAYTLDTVLQNDLESLRKSLLPLDSYLRYL